MVDLDLKEIVHELGDVAWCEGKNFEDWVEPRVNAILQALAERDALKAENNNLKEAARNQEPAIYRLRYTEATSGWVDVTKEVYDRHKDSQNYDAKVFYASPVPAQPSRELLRAIVDATWGHAYESEQVPSTDTADKIINAVLSKFTAAAKHEGTNHGNG